MNKKIFYISPLYFDLINLIFINIVFFAFYEDATAGFLILRVAIGTPIILSSLYFESSSHKVFKNLHNNPEKIRKLVTGGIYSKIRHPIYLGRILLNLGFLIMFPIVPMIMIAIVFIIIWCFIAVYEEKILIEKFGKRYRKYKKRVPMFIPKTK